MKATGERRIETGLASILRGGLLTCLLAWGPAASRVHGQTITGVVRTKSGDAVVSGAIVSVVPVAQNGAPARVLTDSSGRFAVRWRADVTSVIEVKRIGVRPFRSGAMVLSEGETKHVELSVEDVVVPLARVAVTARSACGNHVHDSREVARMLEEVHAAVTVAELSSTDSLGGATVVAYERRIDPGTGTSLEDSVFPIAGRFRWPFASPDPASLAAAGYARSADDGSVTFYAPDARVLASSEFVSSHCFRPVPSPSDTTLAGLHFSPLPRAAVADIEGTLWLERSSAQLRALDARFVGSPLSEFDDRSAISLRLARVADGRLIVAAWSIIAPVVRIVNATDARVGPLRVVDGPRRELAELHESGGFVDFGDGRFSPMGSVAVVVLRDAERGRPVRVAIGGAGKVLTADSSGRAVFEHLFPGRYSLLAYTASGPDVGGSVSTGSVLVSAGARAHVALTLASKESGVSALCAPNAKSEDGGALLLVFVDSSGKRLDTHVSTRLFFTRDELVSTDRVHISKSNFPITSSPSGWYVACGRRLGERGEARFGNRSPLPLGQIGRSGFEVRELVVPQGRR
jgi:hypothetical protein